jgi:hypothetical protein
VVVNVVVNRSSAIFRSILKENSTSNTDEPIFSLFFVPVGWHKLIKSVFIDRCECPNTRISVASCRLLISGYGCFDTVVNC